MATDARNVEVSTEPKTLTAADVMTASPRTCSPFSTVLEAVMIFRDANCGAVPVVDAGVPVGILTDRDVALALADVPDLSRHPVADVMTRGVATIEPGATLDQIKERFAAARVHRLLVTSPDGQLLGLIAWSDVIPDFVDVGVAPTAGEASPAVPSASGAKSAPRSG
jgi:CBS domain-containing protein